MQTAKDRMRPNGWRNFQHRVSCADLAFLRRMSSSSPAHEVCARVISTLNACPGLEGHVRPLAQDPASYRLKRALW